GPEMPRNWSSRLLRRANRCGDLPWRVACWIVRFRERQKAVSYSLLHGLSPREIRRPRGTTQVGAEENLPPHRLESVSDLGSGVSSIIPAYNSAHCLARTIQSSLDQRPPPLEVIVINDGSTDGTAEVARSFGNQIIYLEQENAGQGAARNAGLKVARGEF